MRFHVVIVMAQVNKLVNKRKSLGSVYWKHYNKKRKSYLKMYRIKYRVNHYKKILEMNQNFRQAIKDVIWSIKYNPCTDCHKMFNPVAMQFDHLPEFKKDNSVAVMVNKLRPLSTIFCEIAKCDLVCANCHATRTFERIRRLNDKSL